ncbi:NAD(P)/FAD-dependent oxidoreductase [Microbacterium sp.]|uniref:FAD-dependent oxidoreductase n=1 Tax=Microbacterium sp. TaxID=51671 RepID=UPI002810DF9C|nr:NAD(P)/FAD-dependent oxidoreductase [Microbacterium sp.]
MPDHDVVIVGAGPVGLLLGCLLAERGLDVVICERRDGADGRTRAIGIHRPGLDALDEAGVGEAVRGEALRLEGGEVRSRGRVLASLTFTDDRPVLVLPQRRTDALLRQRLAQLDVGILRSRHEVRAVRDEGDVVRVSVDRADGSVDLTASLVVAADGVHSAIRQSLGIPWRRRPGWSSYAMLDAADPDAGVRAQLYCEPGGLVESFPLPGGMRRWVVRTGASDPSPVDATAFRLLIEERIGTSPVIAGDVIPSAFRAAQHLARASVRGRVVLLGDAAHEVSPIGGQGMNLGWLDASRLAETLGREIGRRQPDLRAFHRRAARSARTAQRRSAFYMAMGMPAGGVPLRGREGLIGLLGTRPLRAATAGLITMRGI